MNPYIYPGLKKDAQMRALQALQFYATPQMVVQAAAQAVGVKAKRVFSPERSKRVALARRCATYIMRHLGQYSLKKIAGIFNQDHTTSLYASNKILADMQIYSKDRQLMLKILHALSPRFIDKEEAIYQKLIDAKGVFVNGCFGPNLVGRAA